MVIYMKLDLINEKVYNEKNEKIVRKIIIECFKQSNKWYRKPLINTCVQKLGLSNQIIKDKSYNSIYTKCKSLIGSVITSMINEGYLLLNDAKYIVLLKEIEVIVQEDEIKNYIGSLLKISPLSKKDIINNSFKYFKVDKTVTKDDDNQLRLAINNILSISINNNILKKENNLYSFVSLTTGLDCKIYNVINESKHQPLSICLQKAISIKGGEFFEAFSVKVLTEYFKYTKNEILESKVTGGAEDNGIDGIIILKDSLEKNTKILMQAKSRTDKQITLKEVREFYGAFKAQNGDVGIFITNSKYHREAIKFAKSLNDLVLVDINILLNIVTITKTGIKEYNDYNILDEKIFVNENFEN